MNKAIELTYELKNELNSLPLFQEKEKKNQLLKQYNSHPLVVNYKELENEVSEYLLQICEIINKK